MLQQTETLKIEGFEVQMSGTIENPLFNAKQIIESVLQYKELNECRFYRDNKSNQDFIQIQAPVKLPDSKNGIKGLDNQHSNTTIYLTEFGLYECLFASNKPFAQKFRLSIMTLLRDLRIGNLKLSVEKECETTKVLEQNKTTLLSYITKISQLEQQILKLQAIVDSASEEIHIYEIEINGEFYRGSALELMRRLKQHRKKSSNPKIRRACSEGAQIKTRLLHSQKVTNRHERNYVERAFIKQTPQDLTMNINIPRVRDSSKVSEECKQELKQVLNMLNPNGDTLTVIDEQTVNNTKALQQGFVEKWKAKYQQYQKFVELIHRNPGNSIKDKNEQLLAKWLYNQRVRYDKLECWQQEQLSKIKYFKPEIKVINVESFDVKLAKVVQIYKEKKMLDSTTLGNLFLWYQEQSQKAKDDQLGEYQAKLLTESGIPLYMRQKDKQDGSMTTLQQKQQSKFQEQWMEHYNYCLKYYQDYKQIPVDGAVQGQFNYGKWCRRQISENIDKLSIQQLQLLADIGLTEKKNKDHLTYMKEFRQYMETHKAFPKTDPNQTKDGYLYKWLHRNIQKPEVAELVKIYSEQYNIVMNKQ